MPPPSTGETAVLRCPRIAFLLFVFLVCVGSRLHSQESPYFVTYDHYLEEARNLELEYFSTFGTQRAGNDFHAFWTEFEYGVTGWWTSELYLDWQTTYNDDTRFTGFRWENRIRPLAREHFINPVLYVEYEQINGADKLLKEIEGHDVEADFAERNAVLAQDLKHEVEFKLILSKSFRGWNLAANPILTKNLSPSEPWEFGYAMGISRWLALRASPRRCTFCWENLILGVEMYGGLGKAQPSEAGLPGTSHYLGPVVAWNLPSGWTVRASTAFGLNSNSHQYLFRWGLSREVSDPFGVGRARATVSTPESDRQREHDRHTALARVPRSAADLSNPLEHDPEAVAAGGKLFEQHCAECHGAQAAGTGRGPSLVETHVLLASPGALYWILSNGVTRRGMPDWSKLPESMRWQIVTFLKAQHRS